MDFTTIILAAGKGTRMNSSLPKVMHKLANKPMLGHILTTIKPLNPKQVIIVVGPEMDDVVDYAHNEYGQGRCVIQQQQNGSADAVKAGLGSIEKEEHAVLVLYGDHPLITSNTINKMYKKLQQDDKNAVVLISFLAVDPAKYGRVIRNNDEVLQIVEYNDCSEDQKMIGLCNSGIMLIRGNVIRDLVLKIDNKNNKGEYYLTDIVKIAQNRGWKTRHITIDESEVLGINSREELVAAERIIQHKLRNEAIAAGVTLIAPETVFFSADTVLAKDVVIHPFVVFGRGVELKEGAEIKSFSHLEGATIGDNSKIGPFSRVRPGTEIASGVAIGNFVELKNAKIETGVKIGHLSYVGDTEIGKKTNIGAGTITCNYDGVNKYRTEIGEEAFIGSNTSLIAPVKIGDHALVAAGSVVTKDVEPEALAVSRVEQKNLPGRAKMKKEKPKHLPEM